MKNKLLFVVFFIILFLLLSAGITNAAAVKLETTSIKISKTYNSNKLTLKSIEGATGYQIYCSTDNKTYKLLTKTTSTSYTHKSLITSKKYYYKARAYVTSGSSTKYGNYSSVKSSTPTLSKPTLTVTNIFNSNKLECSKVAGAKGYLIYRSTNNKKFTLVKTTNSTSYTDLSLTSGKKYYYKVRAYRIVNKKKVYSSYSISVSQTVTLPKVSGVKLSLTNYNTLKISYNKIPNASGYVIYRSTNKSSGYAAIKTTTSLSYTNSSLAKSKTYYYKIRAYRTINGKKVYGKYSSVISQKTYSSRASFVKYNQDTLITALKKEGFTYDYEYGIYQKVYYKSGVEFYEELDLNNQTYSIGKASDDFLFVASYYYNNSFSYGISLYDLGDEYDEYLMFDAMYDIKTKEYDYIYTVPEDIANYPDLYNDIKKYTKSAYDSFNSKLNSLGIIYSNLY